MDKCTEGFFIRKYCERLAQLSLKKNLCAKSERQRKRQRKIQLRGKSRKHSNISPERATWWGARGTINVVTSWHNEPIGSKLHSTRQPQPSLWPVETHRVPSDFAWLQFVLDYWNARSRKPKPVTRLLQNKFLSLRSYPKKHSKIKLSNDHKIEWNLFQKSEEQSHFDA